MTRRATRLAVSSSLAIAAVLALSLMTLATPARAQSPNDSVAVAVGASSRVSTQLQITAGPSGCPGGFTVWWMTLADFNAQGGYWWPNGAPNQWSASFTGVPTYNTNGGAMTTYSLGPNETAIVSLGDLFDETGVTTNWPVEQDPGVQYVFCAFANAGGGQLQSSYSTTYSAFTMTPSPCIFSQGYWKTHSSAWPVTSLAIGNPTTTYTKAQLLSILGTPAGGNGLLILAHQLIAAMLNVANGGDPTPIASSITAANNLIGSLVIPPVGGGFLSPSSTSSLTTTLENYNTSSPGQYSCVVPAKTPSWGALKTLYR